MWNDLILLLSQLKNMIENPMFIETHRLAEFNRSLAQMFRSFGFDDT
jgi:hypothetical protein